MKRAKFWHPGIFLTIVLITVVIIPPVSLNAGANNFDWEVVKKVAVKGIPIMGPPASGPKPFASTGTLGKPLTGTGYAIIIGITDYPGPNSVFEGGYDLSYPADDALAMKQALVNVYGFQESNINLLLDSAANRDNILNTITELQNRIGPDDEVVFFYSGHGVKSLPRLVPSVGAENVAVAGWAGGGKVGMGVWGWENPDDPTDFYLQNVWDRELKEAFSNFETNRIVFIFDMCVAAGMMELGGNGRVVIAATTQVGIAAEALPGEFPYHGFLTYFLVELGMNQGLADFYPADGIITIEEAFDFSRFSMEYVHQEIPIFWQVPTIMDSFIGDLEL